MIRIISGKAVTYCMPHSLTWRMSRAMLDMNGIQLETERPMSIAEALAKLDASDATALDTVLTAVKRAMVNPGQRMELLSLVVNFENAYRSIPDPELGK